MMGRRKKISLAVLALCLLLLAGCQGKPLPEGMEAETLLDAGRDVVLLLVRGEYGAVHALLREDQRELVSTEDIQSLLLRQLDGAGVYKEIESSMTTGQSSDGESYGVAVFYCAYEKDDVLFRLAFDPDMALIGISVEKK